MQQFQELKNFDLNLLKVFAAVAATSNVTQAANSLRLTQSALSHALRRLRSELGDPLFVKVASGVTLTEKAKTLVIPVEELLKLVHARILDKPAEDLRTTKRNIRIFSTDLVETLLLPKLLKVLEREAPHVQLTFRPAAPELPRREFEDGRCDLAIAGFFTNIPDGYYQQLLFKDSFMCAARKDHPRLARSKRLTVDAFCQESHLLIAPGGDLRSQLDTALSKTGRARFVRSGIQGFAAAGAIVAASDCIVTAPSRLLQHAARTTSLRLFAPPIPLPAISIVQTWHARSHSDLLHKWLRGQIHECLN
jgi:DNA-binding transcriptional LysR family regulator